MRLAAVIVLLLSLGATAAVFVIPVAGRDEAAMLPERTPEQLAGALEAAPVLPIGEDAADFYDLAFTVNLKGRNTFMLATGYPAGVYVSVERDAASMGFLSGGTRLERVRGNIRNIDAHSVLLRRRGAFHELVVDGMMTGGLSFSAGAETAFRMVGGVDVTDVKFQPIREPVVFGDDFMREPKEGSPWENISGMWETIGLDHPSLSANPFRLSAVGARALTVVGKPWWDAYRATVSIMGAPGQKMGVVFSCRGPDNYYLFRWSARDAGNVAELLEMRGGGMSPIHSVDAGYVPGVWYKLELVVGMGRARLYVDEHLLFDVVSRGISGGRFGLFADGVNRTYFDDVVIGPCQEAVYNGMSPFRYFRPLSGIWREDAGKMTASLGPPPAFPGLYVCGTNWREWAVDATVLSGNGGIAAAVADPLNFTGLVVKDGAAVLLQHKAGVETLLASRPLNVPPPYALRLETSRCLVSGTVSGASGAPVSLSASLPHGLSGGAGLLTLSGRADFAPNFRVGIPDRQEALLSGNATFSSEREMSSWAGEMSDWYTSKGGSFWYRGFFTGDVEVTAELSDAKIPALGLLALGVRKTGDDGTPMNGYVFTVKKMPRNAAAPHDASSPDNDDFQLKLYREGNEMAERTVSRDALLAASIRTLGDTVAGYVNGIPVLTFRDPASAAIAGYKAAFKAEGFSVPPANILVTAASMRDYQFGTAPTDWRVAMANDGRVTAGNWDVTSRWQCDTRWSFFTGVPNNHGKLAMVWNKKRFTDPIRIEFDAAIRMQRERGNRYEYARDI
ncbi:MAG TPA: hypothetical protein ENN09_05685, partial [Planctomycetes bacterium]|nr:hypothetical protein [Planctomycetota bacterium]